VFVFWLPISFESAAQVSQTVSQNEIQISLTATVCGSWQGLEGEWGWRWRWWSKEELSHTDFEVRLTWVELSWVDLPIIRFISSSLLFAFVMSCLGTRLESQLGSAQFNPTPDSARLISFLVILDDVWHTFLLHKTAILQRILSRTDCLFKPGVCLCGSGQTKQSQN